MSASEKDREAANDLLNGAAWPEHTITEGGAKLAANLISEALATARAEARREAFSDAADYLVEVARILGSNGEVDELGMAAIRAAHASAIETCAAALRAKAGDGSHE